MKLIDGDKLKARLERGIREVRSIIGDGQDVEFWSGYKDACEAYLLYVERGIDTVDAEPVRHGHWETDSDRPDTLICSACKIGFDMWKHDAHNFCPSCGAKMDEEIRICD